MSVPSELVQTLQPVAEALEALGVGYYVGGSVASSTRGIARASVDVDVVAALEARHVKGLVERLRGAYYVSEEAIEEAVRGRVSFNLIHLGTMMKVDVFVVGKDAAFDREALARATPERLDEIGTRLFPVATSEDIVVAKLAWYRLGGERSQRQWADVLGVLRASGDVDTAYLRMQAQARGIQDLLERALAEAGRSR